MQACEIWSVPAERIRDFFLSQNDVRQEADDRFSFGACGIRLTALPPRPVGRFCFPQTQVEFDGPGPDAEAIHRRFVLQLISAGG